MTESRTDQSASEARRLLETWDRLGRSHMMVGAGCSCGIGGVVVALEDFEQDIADYLLAEAERAEDPAVLAYLEAQGRQGELWSISKLLLGLSDPSGSQRTRRPAPSSSAVSVEPYNPLKSFTAVGNRLDSLVRRFFNPLNILTFFNWDRGLSRRPDAPRWEPQAMRHVAAALQQNHWTVGINFGLFGIRISIRIPNKRNDPSNFSNRSASSMASASCRRLPRPSHAHARRGRPSSRAR